jgi:hypothetical protein
MRLASFSCFNSFSFEMQKKKCLDFPLNSFQPGFAKNLHDLEIALLKHKTGFVRQNFVVELLLKFGIHV